MDSLKSLARRVAHVLPYTLPLWLFTSVPFITPDQTLRMVLYIGSIFTVPMVFDLVGGAERRMRLAAEADARPRWEYTALVRLLFVKLIAVQVLMLLVVARKGVSGPSLIILGVIVGLFYGTLAIVLAHELMHRASKLDQGLAEALLSTVSYPHFCIEHVYGHHINVATPVDPASARLGESLYGFLPRTLVGGVRGAWRIETARLARRGHGWLTWRNRMLRYVLYVGLYYAAAWGIARWEGVIVAAIQSAVAVFSLELINYIQHYGLQRREVSPGRYERTDVQHSWNWETRFSGLYFLNLGRHSEHHRIANRRYEALTAADGQPTLPGGLMAMYVAAMIPPLWFTVMNPRVAAVRAAQAGPLAETSTPTPRARVGGFIDRWGGWFFFGAIAAAGAVSGAFGYQETVIFLIGLGIVVLVVREAAIAATRRARA